jgi:hypothetical protein
MAVFVLVLWRLWETFCSASMVAALGLAMLSQFKFTVSIQCNETVEQFRAVGWACVVAMVVFSLVPGDALRMEFLKPAPMRFTFF